MVPANARRDRVPGKKGYFQRQLRTSLMAIRPEGFTATLEILNDDLARIVNQSVLQVVGTPPGRGTALNRSPVESRMSF